MTSSMEINRTYSNSAGPTWGT